MKKLLIVLLTAVLLLSAVACQNKDGKPSQSGGDPSAATYKDTLVVAAYGDQDTLDPHVNVTNDKVLRLFYDSLLTFGQDGSIQPALAESWTHSDDYMTWTFNLRKDVKFANGKEMTSADVIASFDRLMNKEHPLRYSSKVEFIEKIEAVDEYTVVMTCAYQYGIVEDTLAARYCSVLDKDYIEKYGFDIGIDPATINGTGPYKVTLWDSGEQMVFEANEYWWKGEVGTPKMIMKVIPEAASRALAIEAGEVDILDRPGVEDYQRLASIDGLVGVTQLGYGLQGFQFNCSEYSMCKDTKVRQAISHAIDRATAVQALYSPIGEVPTKGPMTPLVFGYVDLGVVPYDVELSKSLLADAGYPNGFDLSLMTYAGYNKGVELAEIVKSQLAVIGINVTIDTVDAATFNASLNGIKPEELKWDMFIMGFGGDLDADSCLRRVWLTSEDGLNTNNYGWYSNARVDELLLKAVTELDKDARKKMYEEIQKIIYLEDPVAVYMNLRSSLYVLTDKVEDFNINALQVVEFEKIKVRN